MNGRTVFKTLGCMDMARIDFRLDGIGDSHYFIEANPLPGLKPGHSDYPMIAQHAGIDYVSLIGNISTVPWGGNACVRMSHTALQWATARDIRSGGRRICCPRCARCVEVVTQAVIARGGTVYADRSFHSPHFTDASRNSIPRLVFNLFEGFDGEPESEGGTGAHA